MASELDNAKLNDLWFRGGFPRSQLAPSDKLSEAWRQSFTSTFLERDLPQLGIRVPAPNMRRFLQMCAHLHGQLWNASKIGGSLGVTNKTINHYLSILEQTYLLRRLMPLETNLKNAWLNRPRFSSGTPVFFTVFWASPTVRIGSGIRRLDPRGKDLLSKT